MGPNIKNRFITSLVIILLVLGAGYAFYTVSMASKNGSVELAQQADEAANQN